MIYPAFAAEYDQIVSTSDGTLDVGIYTIPKTPNIEEPTKLKIEFLKPDTERIQQHIDYRVSVTKDGDYVFGPMSRLLHTSPGFITIPVEFSENGLHKVHIEMEGILFQPIPLETATLTINVSSEKQWGTVSVDKPILELPYTTASNTQYEKIKIFGTVEDPNSSTFVYMTVSEPDGKTYQTKVRVVKGANEQGYYENFVLVCCNNAGTYSVSVEWKGNHIGTVTIDVNAKPKSQPTDTPTAETSIPGWIKNNAGWWADGQIDDGSFVTAIQWLISNDVMTIPPTEQGTGSDDVIPSWIKNNAGWWADGQIDDGSFVSGLQWLISNGIMKIS